MAQILLRWWRNLPADLALIERQSIYAFKRAAAAQMKRLGMSDSDILEVTGWKDAVMLRRYTATVAAELAQNAHARFSPSDSIPLTSGKREIDDHG